MSTRVRSAPVRCARVASRRAASTRVRRGFTLLEALVALVIVGTAVAAALAAFSAAMRVGSQVGGHAQAVALADARLSELSILSADSVRYYARPREGSFPAPFDAYRWTARLQPRRESPALLRAQVVVSWRQGEYALATEFFRVDRLPGARWRAR
ncbi:MAG TPA: prepilin-type N-terminal cleavage/methylation domain-containing protein [Gemmatimonadaceae bacterium]|nr:prepilin-type N-terminal cleavage/methylation domain-containing protein [Gemmatimonadaceae bacterium]